MNATTATLPADHLDLLDRPLPAVLTTHLADGRLQSTVVWYWREADHLLLSTMEEFYKARNLRARPRATLLVLEPDGDRRWIEVRGTVLPEASDAVADLDALAVRYTGASPYFGAVVPAGLAQSEHPATFRLVPHTVVTGPTAPHHPAGTVRGAAAHLALPSHDATRADAELPPSHLDLFDRPLLAALSTRMPDGSARTQPARCRCDAGVVVLSTTLEDRTGRNLLADPRATVLVVDPADSSRWIEVRGDVELVSDGAVDVLDRLTREYVGAPADDGHVAPDELRTAETRVVVRIRPVRVNCDAIHR